MRLHFADMLVLVQMFLQEFKKAPLFAREKFERSCFESSGF